MPECRGSIPDGVFECFVDLILSATLLALGSVQSLTKMSTTILPCEILSLYRATFTFIL
jgi:hypothetical protein